MATETTRLKISLDSATQSVSAMSSLLRVMQAALRESARGTPEGAGPFAEKPEPILLVTTDSGSDGKGLELKFAFADAATRRPIDALSDAGFANFLDSVESLLKSQPRLTLWGGPARLSSKGNETADRIALAWQELSRLPNVSLELGDRRIEVSESSIEISS